MPCYDKKLEASRNDFYHTTWTDDDSGGTVSTSSTPSIREVDVVLTTTELLGLMTLQHPDEQQQREHEQEPPDHQDEEEHPHLFPDTASLELVPGQLGSRTSVGEEPLHGGSGGCATFLVGVEWLAQQYVECALCNKLKQSHHAEVHTYRHIPSHTHTNKRILTLTRTHPHPHTPDTHPRAHAHARTHTHARARARTHASVCVGTQRQYSVEQR